MGGLFEASVAFGACVAFAGIREILEGGWSNLGGSLGENVDFGASVAFGGTGWRLEERLASFGAISKSNVAFERTSGSLEQILARIEVRMGFPANAKDTQ